ncbi:nucleoside recognition protein [Pararhodospirillum oryzae]|uniref:Nucleoside recognition protein n=1 Tax=Pararhodospirillum oryzae TaxID=478448 RepID=A0A512H6E4_9PROT|nr:nucleoside recognition protein [Pararhodospirillum oryzae]GEO81017.1 nucleoside recognition protein [Pararhodospirillum oryzae]
MSSFLSVLRFVGLTGREGLRTYWTLVRLMIPVMIGVKILVELGLLPVLARLFAPVMHLVGLPPETGLVWASALLVNLYGGAVVLLALLPTMPLTAAQATIIGLMMLMAHAIPLEQSIARRAGTSFVFSSVLRIGGAFAAGALFNLFCQATGWLQQPALVVLGALHGGGVQAGAWGAWLLDSARSLLMILGIVVTLVFLLRVLDRLGITGRLTRALAPVLGRVGIGGRAMPLTMVGVLLGLSYGGALIIREAQAGTIPRRQIFLALCLLSLCHSLIEDTLLVMALGADWTGVLVWRVAFTLAVIWGLDRMLDALPERMAQRFLYTGKEGVTCP